MRKLFLSLVLLLGWVVAAHAVSPLGCGQLTSISSATLLSSITGGIPNGANLVSLAVEVQSVRYRDDGVAPTAGVGQLLVAGGPWPYTGNLQALQFIQTTSGAVVDFCFYRQ